MFSFKGIDKKYIDVTHFILKTWIALSEEFSGIVNGNAKDDDFGFVDIQPGFVDGQGLIFLQQHNTFCIVIDNKKWNLIPTD